MKAITGIYETRENASEAIESLKNAGYPDNRVLLVNKDELIHNHISIKLDSAIERTEMMVGLVTGLVAGSLMGMHLFELPGFHSLYTGGVLRGAFIGGLLGMWVSGVIAILTALITAIVHVSKYGKYVSEGKFLVFVEGDRREVTRAHTLLHTPDVDLELE